MIPGDESGLRGQTGPRISTDFTYRGIDAVILENSALRVLVLPGKGGDIVEFRDKRTDVDVLWRTPHNWTPPESRYVPTAAETGWNEHYPGGWQVNLPVAGGGWEFDGSAYGQHGESALLPWDAEVVRDDGEAVTLRLTVELTRYPFVVERDLTLPAGDSRLEIEESVTNRGERPLEYVWQQHVTLGQPLLSSAARLDLPDATGVNPKYGDAFPNARLEGDVEFEWPHAPGRDGTTVDLREIPPEDSTIHDQSFAVDMADGWYALTNPDIDLGFALTFPLEPFESLWYWQPFGGFHESPWFNRNYNVGLEPTTAYPGDPDVQRENGTMKELEPGETVEAEFTATTYGGLESVSDVSPDGTIEGTPLEGEK
ncbi:aldose 1-epimerase [Natronolimnobius sp. AArcel1]|uniref:aldose 1-epimerase n=1 Tax=Natronolimnobius sp. AArcel1 TaxID=1679093 RepID=UPI0013ED39FC|nr:aldose 1-epimerase [Natronolimnobius sp. AArcel1]NGM70623.1 aldose 1-epimerase [Natronolimnobius sp. AArcel1]